MLDVDTTFLVQFTDASQHKCVICSATLHDIADGLFTAELWEEDGDAKSGQEFLAYYEIDGMHVKQLACIDMVIPSDFKPMITFRLLEKPVNAENREVDRIDTRNTGLTVELGSETDCPLIDVSVFGFAVIAMEKHAIASAVSVSMKFNGTQYMGKASIENVIELPEGGYRYGLRCIDNSRVSVSLKAGIEQITSAHDEKQNLPKMGTS